METQPQPNLILDQTLTGIVHSTYSEPEIILEGIGPASFRSHYLSLENGVVLDLFIAELTVATLPHEVMPGETSGLSLNDVIGRRIVAVACDVVYSTIIILDGGLFLKDDYDDFYGNTLLAGRLSECYSQSELREFLDYWSEQPLDPGYRQHE